MQLNQVKIVQIINYEGPIWLIGKFSSFLTILLYLFFQALGMLFWHKHNIERALSDLPNFTPFPDEWSVEDKVLFEQAFGFHGKSFHRIKQMVS